MISLTYRLPEFVQAVTGDPAVRVRARLQLELDQTRPEVDRLRVRKTERAAHNSARLYYDGLKGFMHFFHSLPTPTLPTGISQATFALFRPVVAHCVERGDYSADVLRVFDR